MCVVHASAEELQLYTLAAAKAFRYALQWLLDAIYIGDSRICAPDMY